MVTLRMSEDRYNSIRTMLSMLREFCGTTSCEECPVRLTCLNTLEHTWVDVWDGVNVIHDGRE